MGYIKYVKICKSIGTKPNKKFVHFATRYKFAGQLERIEVHGYSETTQQIYLEALRVSLAFSAVESLNKVLGNRSISKLSDVKLSQQFKSRKLMKFREFLNEYCETKLNNRLTNLCSSKRNEDIFPVIEAIRHLTFHGIFNSSNSGLNNKTGYQFLTQLSFKMFKEMDKHSDKIADHLISEIQIKSD